MPDTSDRDLPPPPAQAPAADKPDAPPQAAERATADHGGFSDTDGESTMVDVTIGDGG